MTPATVLYEGSRYAVVAERSEFGILTRTLIGLPRRAFSDKDLQFARSVFEPFVDARKTLQLLTPAQMAIQRAGTSWLSSTRRAQASLLAWFILTEDPQRRLEVLDVAPLLHQRSLVEHVLTATDLRRVLIADEVGLGKTVEAGLIIQRLLRSGEVGRALYLAPARLVRNVIAELTKLGLDARRWTAMDSDARIDQDKIVVASIQKSVRESNTDALIKAGPWDLIVADECHHLSDWAEGGGSPNAGYRLLSRLIATQRPDVARLLLLSGTPHQGHQARFENLLTLLQGSKETASDTAGRVIFRTKEMVTDWNGRPLFPTRNVLAPNVVSLGAEWAGWYQNVASLYENGSGSIAGRRAGGWAKGQALQWVASSVSAGLGFLTRLAIRRLRWSCDNLNLAPALAALRPYRGGPPDEPLQTLYARLLRQMSLSAEDEDAEEVGEDDEAGWLPDPVALAKLLRTGISLKAARADADKWDTLLSLLNASGGEKVVIFCQPVETVEVVAGEIQRRFGQRPAIIVGGQTDLERDAQVASFRDRAGKQFLVSSRAGGEGINLQVSRRLIHLDVPWNPMDLEQRVGRVHRFGSRETILVDTIVVAGTREADAYRIAREKLHRIVANLAPDAFETLFSRVMSLVPPEELAGVMSITAPWPPGGEVESKIADIVGTGFKRWSEFTGKFSANESLIRSIEPGLCTWGDLREFLERSCNAERGKPATRPVFTITASGVGVGVASATLQTLDVFGSCYVCDETEGLPAEDDAGQPIQRIGTGDPRVVEALRLKITEQAEDRVGSVRLTRSTLPEWLPLGSSLVVVYAAQRVQLVGGVGEERTLHLQVFILREGQQPTRLPRALSGELIRAICSAERQATPDPALLNSDLITLDADMIALTRTAASEDAEAIPIVGVWPVALFSVSVP